MIIALVLLDRTERRVGELDDNVLLAIVGVAVSLGHSIVAGRECIGQAFRRRNRIGHNVLRS